MLKNIVTLIKKGQKIGHVQNEISSKRVLPGKSFVSEDHYSVICFSSHSATDTLSRVSHSVERQKVVFTNLEIKFKTN
jgi:hypothetical protein